MLESRIAHRLTRPVGRPSKTKVKRFYEEFEYQAQSWDKPRRVVAKIEWHPDELFPRLGFIVTTCRWSQRRLSASTTSGARQSNTSRRASRPSPGRRLSCKRLANNEVRLQLHALAYNLGIFLQGVELREEVASGHSIVCPGLSKPAQELFDTPVPSPSNWLRLLSVAPFSRASSKPFSAYAHLHVPHERHRRNTSTKAAK